MAEFQLIDDFETGVLHASYEGDRDNFTINSDSPLSGNYDLFTNSDAKIFRTDYNIIRRNNTDPVIRYLVGLNSSNSGNKNGVIFGGPNSNNCYYVGVVDSKGLTIKIWIIEDGVLTELATSVSGNTLLSIEVIWDTNGDITLNAYSDANYTNLDTSINTNNTTYSSGGIGFKQTAISARSFDNLYAYVEVEAPAGFTRKIKIAGTFQDKPIKTKVGGTFVDKPLKVKVGGVFQ